MSALHPTPLCQPPPLARNGIDIEKSSTTTAAAASFSFCTNFLLFWFFCSCVQNSFACSRRFCWPGQAESARTQLLRGSWLSFLLLFGFYFFFWEVFWDRLVSIGLNASRCRPRLFDCCCSSVILSYNFIASATPCAVMIFIGTCSWHMTSGMAL